jgi:hypothetical protein
LQKLFAWVFKLLCNTPRAIWPINRSLDHSLVFRHAVDFRPIKVLSYGTEKYSFCRNNPRGKQKCVKPAKRQWRDFLPLFVAGNEHHIWFIQLATPQDESHC